MPAEQPFAQNPSRDYALVHCEGDGLCIVLRYRDAGIRLTPAGLEWTTGEEPRSAAYGDIAEIRLSIGSLPKSGSFGTCTISFRSGHVLSIVGVTSRGTPTPERADLYAAFVRDLHARLGADNRARIAFVAGNSEGRQRFGLFAVILGVAFFVAMPVVLLLVTGDIRTLAVLIFGVLFVTPALKTLRSNTPRSYAPAALPEELLP